MKYNKITRRHFLQGAGKTFLTLPFLPSLMNHAEAQTLPVQKFFIMYWSGHGGIEAANMYPFLNHPTVSGALTNTTLYSAVNHVARSGRLTQLKTTRASNLSIFANAPGHRNREPSQTAVPEGYGLNPSMQDLDGGAARVSPVLGNFISDAHLNKMNLIAGMDMMFYPAHTRGQTGDYANDDGIVSNSHHISTIDHVIGNYSSFYGSANPVARSFFFNHPHFDDYLSSNWNGSSRVANVNSSKTLGEAFTRLFGSLIPNPGDSSSQKKTFLLNNIHEDYARLARGAYGDGRRIGQEDRNRLEEVMTSLDSVLRGITSTVNTCTAPGVASNDSRTIINGAGETRAFSLADNVTIMDLFSQIIATSIACGRTNVAIVAVPSVKDHFTPNGMANPTFNDHGQSASGATIDNSDSHQGLFHRWEMPNRQRYLADGARWVFQNSFYNVMRRLDGMSSPHGGTMLDSGLMLWTQESGMSTHNGQCLPVITAGSANGYFNTGNFIDYRNLTRTLFSFSFPIAFQGLAYNRLLGTVLQGMGVPPTSFEQAASRFTGSSGRIPTSSRGTVYGYGHPIQDDFEVSTALGRYTKVYDYQLDDMSVPLPILKS